MNENNNPPQEPDDVLASSLRREAMAERPAFSVQVHNRILESLHDERPLVKLRRSLWPAIAVAAAILLAVGLAARWMMHSPVSPPQQIVKKPPLLPPTQVQHPSTVSMPDPIALSVHVDGLVSAKLWPPQIRINLPGPIISSASEPVETAPTSTPAFGVSPESLLTELQQPTASAQQALTDILPPNLKALATMLFTFND